MRTDTGSLAFLVLLVVLSALGPMTLCAFAALYFGFLAMRHLRTRFAA